MACRIAHDVPPEVAAAPPRPELHALAMPRDSRGEIFDLLLEGQRLPGMRLLRVYVPAPALRGDGPLPVLLANDGHKVFEPANHAAVPAWQQGGTLQMHRLMDGMLCLGTVRPALVVAVGTHSGHRADQYVPIRARLGDVEFGGLGDQYLDLLEHEVLPLVARKLRHLPVSTAAADRVLLGASIGALAALHGVLSRSDVFGNAIALSPSAWVDDGFLTRAVQQRGSVAGRIAADIGAGERPPIRAACGELFTALRTLGGERVHAHEVAGVHNEDSWRARLPALLQHVLAPAR